MFHRDVAFWWRTCFHRECSIGNASSRQVFHPEYIVAHVSSPMGVLLRSSHVERFTEHVFHREQYIAQGSPGKFDCARCTPRLSTVHTSVVATVSTRVLLNRALVFITNVSWRVLHSAHVFHREHVTAYVTSGMFE